MSEGHHYTGRLGRWGGTIQWTGESDEWRIDLALRGRVLTGTLPGKTEPQYRGEVFQTPTGGIECRLACLSSGSEFRIVGTKDGAAYDLAVTIWFAPGERIPLLDDGVYGA